MILIILIISVVVWVELKLSPRLETTRDRQLLLFYTNSIGRDYIKLWKV